jgi:hypothetical protein
MNKKKKKKLVVPAFKTEDEEREFWDNLDLYFPPFFGQGSRRLS